MRWDEETRHLERLEKIVTQKPHSAFLTKVGEEHVDKLQEAINFFRERYEKLKEDFGNLSDDYEQLERQIDAIKKLCNENVKAIKYKGGLQYVIPVYQIMDIIVVSKVSQVTESDTNDTKNVGI